MIAKATRSVVVEIIEAKKESGKVPVAANLREVAALVVAAVREAMMEMAEEARYKRGQTINKDPMVIEQ